MQSSDLFSIVQISAELKDMKMTLGKVLKMKLILLATKMENGKGHK
jgi:hypothetical protein